MTSAQYFLFNDLFLLRRPVMAIRQAHAIWDGNLKNGKGQITLDGSGLQADYGFASRFQDGVRGTNPEELIAGAHAGCFSMALANELEMAGHPPTHVETFAHVHLIKSGNGFSIPKIELETEVEVPGIDDDSFHRLAKSAKENCPVSRLLSGAEITLSARLLTVQKA
jgi:lipoyl-dependent peroxiredoxin